MATKYAIRGNWVHDASIVATLLAHKVRVLISQGGDDAVRFEDEIEVVSSEDVLSGTKPQRNCAAAGSSREP